MSRVTVTNAAVQSLLAALGHIDGKLPGLTALRLVRLQTKARDEAHQALVPCMLEAA